MTQDSTIINKQSRVWVIATIFFGLLSAGLIIALIIVATRESEPAHLVEHSAKNDHSVPLCGSTTNPNGNIIDQRDPMNPGPFYDLTQGELYQLSRFLEDHPTILAAKPGQAKINSSYFYMADLFLPRKADIIKYLDKGGPQPIRQARAIVFRGDLTPPVIQEYICGPFPDLNSCDLFNSSIRRNPLEFSVRPFNIPEFKELNKMLAVVDKEIGYILQESFQTTWTQCSHPQDCFRFGISPIGTGPLGDINKRKLWIPAFYNVKFFSLHPVDHAVLVDFSGSDVTKWYIEKVWYAGRLYNSTEELILGYNASSIPKIKTRSPQYTDNLYSTLHRRGDPLPPKPQRPPTQVEPDGKRYSLKEKKVEYMGWSFYFRLSPLSGPAVFDVKFQGERIAFEISLMEIAVFYSGLSPFMQVTDYVDSGALLGARAKALVPGVDCPDTATLINQTFIDRATGLPVVYPASLCLFEHNNGYPLRRHMTYAYNDDGQFGGMMDSILIFRAGLEITNYDYIVDFIFHQNGVFESRFMSTGYILSSPYAENERSYGFRIEDTVLGNLHHHLVHFKVDLDIDGPSNRYQTLNMRPDEAPFITYPSETYNQVRMTPSLKTTEKGAVLKYNFDTPMYHLVYNNNSRTNYGEFRSYRIQLDGMSKSLFAEGKENEPTISWSRHQMAVTKHKDEEFISSSNYGMFDSANPVVDFSSFYQDDENIVDEDLVFWITSGLHHIPHTEDLPVTPTVGNHLSFFLLPYNYFPECPSMGSRDAIYIKHIDKRDTKKGISVDRYGNSRNQCIISQPPLEENVARNPDSVLESGTSP